MKDVKKFIGQGEEASLNLCSGSMALILWRFPHVVISHRRDRSSGCLIDIFTSHSDVVRFYWIYQTRVWNS